MPQPRGENGFNYDPYFEVEGLGKTMTELTDAEKNAISHRGRAVRDAVSAVEYYYSLVI